MSVIINGGGISGVILALMLSKFTLGKLRINIIERLPSSLFSSAYDTRYIALSRNSYCTLMSFGISSILSSCSVAIKEIEVSFDNRDVVLSASDYQMSALGYVIELHSVTSKIFNMLNKLTSVDFFCPAKLQQIIRNRFDCSVILHGGREISAQLLIAADGSYSVLGDLCGIEWEFFDYKQVAVIANIVTALPHEGRAFEIFTCYGSVALLPILNSQSAVIWCIPISYKEEVLNWSSSEFCQSLQKIVKWKLGAILDVDKRYCFSLFLRKSKSHISHRLALVGNAAQTLHPIAGQGFNLGFRDVLNISKIISNANVRSMDIGDYNILKLYEKSRQLDQGRVITMTHGLVCMFNGSCFPLIFSGNFVLSAMRHSKLLRDIFVRTVLSW
ncbi:FAD-dependent monooxygenase [Blochmannia endosymbiont of Polyrhachis (Hedomyrma) turneri]|uniref:FAD-dependent monooxygenase n=1 Tax=Blochmannia endosymbiont of Polyrhachis (Hedomyrma) turneri TaxID=1505596 RepID=UPI00061A8071|nr:FAD-dependent monooxygenase [Blochmannia endosymbiont of Polyrhachis (Hedomyrma) turneri]AKC59830.1 2-octaprenyl-6-methoxyphenol hydroxylase [Blochmannia endosymbiont of Polyrhachis (Hedomyrma) turneri]